jgi:hypothetical protein
MILPFQQAILKAFCFRDWTSWSLVSRRRPAKTRNASSKGEYGVLESGAIRMLSAVDCMSTEKWGSGTISLQMNNHTGAA